MTNRRNLIRDDADVLGALLIVALLGLALLLTVAARDHQAPAPTSSSAAVAAGWHRPAPAKQHRARYCWTSRTAVHPRRYCSWRTVHTPTRSTLEQFRARTTGGVA